MQKLREAMAALMKEIPAIVLALKHEKTPLPAKILAGLTVAYALSPIDLIPDFIPFLGYLDDLIILPALIALTVRRIPPDVLAECRQKTDGMTRQGAKWYYALPVVGIWVLIIALILVCVLI